MLALLAGTYFKVVLLWNTKKLKAALLHFSAL
jgi:hypothetical protein